MHIFRNKPTIIFQKTAFILCSHADTDNQVISPVNLNPQNFSVLNNDNVQLFPNPTFSTYIFILCHTGFVLCQHCFIEQSLYFYLYILTIIFLIKLFPLMDATRCYNFYVLSLFLFCSHICNGRIELLLFFKL